MSGGSIERRHVLKVLSAAGLGSAVFGRALVALAADAPKITEAMIAQASWISGVAITDDQRKLMLKGLNEAEAGYAKMRAVALQNAVPPAFTFDPAGIGRASRAPDKPRRSPAVDGTKAPAPGSKDDVAFAPVTLLSTWLRHKAISSTELTTLYLERIGRLDPKLFAVITLTPEQTIEQTKAADAKIAKGR